MSRQRAIEPRRSDQWLYVVLALAFTALVTWRLVLPALQTEDFGIASEASSGGWTSDFAAHLTFARAVWAGNAGYDVASHLRATSERAGRTVEHALPFGYSPIALWILAPFCLASTKSAYIVWTYCGVAAACWIMWHQRSIWIAACLFTPLSFMCLKLGQTAIFTACGLLALLQRDRSGFANASDAWKGALVLCLLAAKPPAALTAAAALFASRRWRVLALASLVSLVSLILITPVLGTHWVHEYVAMLGHYDLETAAPAYRWALVPETMSNLRAMLHVGYGTADHVAARISGFMWIAALLATACVRRLRGISLETCWIVAVFAFLLFCPHLTSTEDLHLIVILALLPHGSSPHGALARPAIAVCVLLALFLSPGLQHPTTYRIPIVFALKTFVCLVLVRARLDVSA